MTSMDVLPALAELCDVDLPEKPLDGKSGRQVVGDDLPVFVGIAAA